MDVSCENSLVCEAISSYNSDWRRFWNGPGDGIEQGLFRHLFIKAIFLWHSDAFHRRCKIRARHLEFATSSRLVVSCNVDVYFSNNPHSVSYYLRNILGVYFQPRQIIYLFTVRCKMSPWILIIYMCRAKQMVGYSVSNDATLKHYHWQLICILDCASLSPWDLLGSVWFGGTLNIRKYVIQNSYPCRLYYKYSN